MQKTLGGDRLGAGKKMQVSLHGYERSTHDLGHTWRSTIAAGTLVPFLKCVALPGDTFDIDLDADIKTLPTIGPLFGSFKLQLDVFLCPIRLYQGQLHNNKIGIGMEMANVKLPLMTLKANAAPLATLPDLDNSQIHPSCIFSYLGIRGVGINLVGDTHERQFNALPFLMYLDIYKQYYTNKMETIGAYLHTPAPVIFNTVTSVTVDGNTIPQAPAAPSNYTLYRNSIIKVNYAGAPPDLTTVLFTLADGRIISYVDLVEVVTLESSGTYRGYFNWRRWRSGSIVTNWDYQTPNQPVTQLPVVTTFNLSEIDKMRETILSETLTPTAFSLNDHTIQPYSTILGSTSTYHHMMGNQEGLMLKTYQSDLFNNWLNQDMIDGAGGISAITAIDTSGGSFNIDTLNLSKKIYDLLNRVIVSGGTYDDWIDAAYAADKVRRVESPIYCGGLSKEVIFQEVIQGSGMETDISEIPLGSLAGKGIMAGKHKGGKVTVKVDEPAYLIGIASLTPRLDYSQGNDWDIHLLTMDDLHKPALDEIGFQDLITEQMAWWDTKMEFLVDGWIQKSAGKQPAWINYMTETNKVKGNFALKDSQMFMTLNRRYECDNLDNGIKDLTTYVDPAKFNHVFAQTALDGQNFWLQISIDNIARRKMSAKPMPNL